MPVFGTFYFDPVTAWPAVMLRALDGDKILVRVWAESGDLNMVATESNAPGVEVFVRAA